MVGPKNAPLPTVALPETTIGSACAVAKGRDGEGRNGEDLNTLLPKE
jgi:hypothetical protein